MHNRQAVTVLKSLVGVDERFLARGECVDCHAETVGNHFHARRGPCRCRDDPVVIEIENRRAVDLRGADVEFLHVRDPLRVPRLCDELSVQ